MWYCGPEGGDGLATEGEAAAATAEGGQAEAEGVADPSVTFVGAKQRAASEADALVPDACGICMDEVEGEKCVMPCMHSVCNPCLAKWLKHGGDHCPFCRKEFAGWCVDVVPVHFVYSSLTCCLHLYALCAGNRPTSMSAA